MIERFCDGCGSEVQRDATVYVMTALVPTKDKSGASEVIVQATGDPPQDLCKYCVIDAFNRLDDRPSRDCAAELAETKRKLVETEITLANASAEIIAKDRKISELLLRLESIPGPGPWPPVQEEHHGGAA